MPDDLAPAKRPRGRPRAFDDKTEQNTIRSLDRAMAILEALAERGSATLTDLARALGQSAPTVYRVLVTLEGRGIVELQGADQTWAVGPRAFLIGSSFLRRSSVVERARAPMRRLRDETGETANLGVPKGDQVMFVSQVETDASLRAFFPPGTLSPLHASGIGKALLAWFDAPRREAYLARADLALDDPVDRSAVKELVSPFRKHAGDVIVHLAEAGLPVRARAARHPGFQVGDGRRAHAQLDEIHGHGRYAEVRPSRRTSLHLLRTVRALNESALRLYVAAIAECERETAIHFRCNPL